MTQKTIVVLANSLKHGQHCVAGKCINSGHWIRPVSNNEGAELSHEQAKCKNPYGIYLVKPKQKIKIGISHHFPLINQPDNYVIDDSIWEQNYKIEDHELNNYLDNPSNLWGSEDRVPFIEIKNNLITIEQSLYLVEVQNLNLYKSQHDNKRRASFSYAGNQYDLSVTDPKFDKIKSGDLAVSGVLCISLGEVFKGDCYKIVATIF
jgi:hypothetical protein